MKRLLGASLAVLATVVVLSFPCAAAQYPQKPITINCVFGPGGSADLGLRVVAEYATKNGFTMNVVNKAGGGGSQSAMDTLRARPDGYTVLFSSPSAMIILPSMQNAGYTLEDFTPVANISDMPNTFCALTASGIKTFKEWMDRAIAEPGKYNYGSPGSVTSQRLLMTTLIQDKFPGANVPHVPYQSGHEANTALLGGHTKAAFGVPGTNKNYLQSGEFTLLAVTSAKRLPEYPNVPTFSEMFGDRYVWASFHGLFVPKATPKDVVDKLSSIVKAALEDPEVLAKFDKIGITADYLNPADYAKETSRVLAFVKEAVKGLKM